MWLCTPTKDRSLISDLAPAAPTFVHRAPRNANPTLVSALKYKVRTEDRWEQSQWLPEEGRLDTCCWDQWRWKGLKRGKQEEFLARPQTPGRWREWGVQAMTSPPATRFRQGEKNLMQRARLPASPTHCSLSHLWILLPLTPCHKLPSNSAFL